MRARPAAALAAALLLAGCTAERAGSDLEQPLAALPECSDPPRAEQVELPEGLLLPDGLVPTGTTRSGPLTQVRGYLARTPVEVRIFYERLEEVELLTAEDEVFEAELLFRDGDQRTYVKAVAVCDRGSTLDVLVAPEAAAGAVPVPSGSPAG